MIKIPHRLLSIFTVIFLLTTLLMAASPPAFAYNNVFNRTLEIGSSTASAVTTNVVSFTFPFTASIGSILLQYCDDPINEVACVAPAGFDSAGANLDSQSGETGFVATNIGNNQILLSRTPANVGLGMNVYSFSNITNPSNLGPFYLRISTYSTSDASGPILFYGATVGSINQGIHLKTEVPEILNFCAGITITFEDCSTATGDFINLGTLSDTYTKFGTSQFMIGTNAPNGYVVITSGLSMTSGTDQITPLAAPTASIIGNSQFGINLRANTTPLLGQEPFGPGIGVVRPNYDIPNRYRYSNGDIVVQAVDRSLHKLFTVSYIVNINSTQPSGVYNTTITYVCVGGF